jgi:hypothetical protein
MAYNIETYFANTEDCRQRQATFNGELDGARAELKEMIRGSDRAKKEHASN